VPALPSVLEAAPIESAGAPRTGKAATLVDDLPADLIVSFTFTSLPWAVAGTTNESRAVPAVNDFW